MDVALMNLEMEAKKLNEEVDFRALFENAPGLYLILLPDSKFTITAVSDAYANATMTQRKEISGKGLFEVFPDNPDDPQADGVSNLRASLNFVLKNKTAHTMAVQKYDIRRTDGTFEERYWSPLNKPVLNAAGEIEYIIHRVEDVTDFMHLKKEQRQKDKLTEDLQKRVQETEMEVFKRAQEIQRINAGLEKAVEERTGEIMKREKLFRAMIEKSADMITLALPEGKLIYASPSLTHVLGFTQEEYFSRPAFEFIHPEDVPGLLEQMKGIINTPGKSFYRVQRLLHKDGTYRWCEGTITNMLHDPDVGALVSNFRDITKVKKIEIELKEKALYVEKRASELYEVLLKYMHMDFSAELSVSDKGDEWDAIAVGLNTLRDELQSHIQKVEDSNKQLEAVNKELEAFTYSVSHDLRAPLRAIDGFANIFSEEYAGKLDGEGTRFLAVIQSNAKKMGMLIDDLLSFSRLGRKEVQKTTVNMKAAAENALLELSRAPGFKTKVIVGNLHPAPADYALIGHVFENLISNGIKYSSKTLNPEVKITSEKRNNEIIYTVKDNGAGFDMQYAHKLFGVFQRLHSTNEFEGTGVGLAIVQRIISKHGGKVWAEGKVDSGAAFSFSLPLD